MTLNTEIIQLLIQHGSDLNQHDDDGETALNFAAIRGHTEVAEALIEGGASIDIPDRYGQLPI